MTYDYSAWRRKIQREQTANRFRSLGYFVLALVYAALAERVAGIATSGFCSGTFNDLISRVLYLGLLICGFGVMSMAAQRRKLSLAAVGLPVREGSPREWAMGAALGWGGAVACVLPLAVFGTLSVALDGSGSAWSAFFINTLTLAVATLVQELIFRGYPFQRLIETVGPTFATVVMTLLFTAFYTGGSDAGSIATINSLLMGLVLATTYLRTRAIWVSWGLHFAWTGATALLFGLPVADSTQYSPVIQSYSSGAIWLGGGGYGPEGSVIATLVLIGLFAATMRATRELRYRWAMPMLVGAGYAVDIDAAAQRQHESAMGPAAAPAGTTLVQILPSVPPSTIPLPTGEKRESSE